MRDAKNKLNCEVNDDCCLEMMSYEVRNGVYEKHRRSEQEKINDQSTIKKLKHKQNPF